MKEELMKEAEALGINASLYYVLPADRREDALRQDIDKAKKSASKDAE